MVLAVSVGLVAASGLAFLTVLVWLCGDSLSAFSDSMATCGPAAAAAAATALVRRCPFGGGGGDAALFRFCVVVKWLMLNRSRTRSLDSIRLVLILFCSVLFCSVLFCWYVCVFVCMFVWCWCVSDDALVGYRSICGRRRASPEIVEVAGCENFRRCSVLECSILIGFQMSSDFLLTST